MAKPFAARPDLVDERLRRRAEIEDIDRQLRQRIIHLEIIRLCRATERRFYERLTQRKKVLLKEATDIFGTDAYRQDRARLPTEIIKYILTFAYPSLRELNPPVQVEFKDGASPENGLQQITAYPRAKLILKAEHNALYAPPLPQSLNDVYTTFLTPFILHGPRWKELHVSDVNTDTTLHILKSCERVLPQLHHFSIQSKYTPFPVVNDPRLAEPWWRAVDGVDPESSRVHSANIPLAYVLHTGGLLTNVVELEVRLPEYRHGMAPLCASISSMKSLKHLKLVGNHMRTRFNVDATHFRLYESWYAGDMVSTLSRVEKLTMDDIDPNHAVHLLSCFKCPNLCKLEIDWVSRLADVDKFVKMLEVVDEWCPSLYELFIGERYPVRTFAVSCINKCSS